MKILLAFTLALFCSTALGQRYVRTFATVADMLAANPKDVSTNAMVLGWASPSDGRAVNVYYDASSTAATNRENIFKPNNYNGRWIAVANHGYFPTTKYNVYSPSVTRRTMLDPGTSPWQYNHDTTIAYYQDRWFAQWNANTDRRESQPGQVLLQSTSTDFITWTTPVEMFHSSTYSSNTVTMGANDTEWQPGLVKVGTELWSIWSRNDTTAAWPTGYKLYFSRLSSSTTKWQNTQLSITYTDPDGSVYYGFATQNPIVLKSGRVIAPVIWNSQDVVTPTPAAWTSTSYFWINKKRAGCIYTDDNGVTWKLGGVTTLPGYDHALWEPVIAQSADGNVVMYCRNLDYKSFGSDKYMLWAQGYSEGEFFDPLQTIRIDVSSSRLGLLYQNGKHPRQIGLHNDWKSAAGANFVAARRNASMFFSRSGQPDMAPGVNFSLDFGSVSYPQGDIHNNKVYVMWTQSQEPNFLMTSEIDPAPDVNKWYISPRQNDAVNPYVVWTNSSPTRFIHNATSEMESVRSTSTWANTNLVSVGAWVYKDAAGASTALQTIVDNRLLQSGVYGGFIWGSLSGVPLLSLVMTNGTGTNYSFSTLSVPSSEWCYMGLTIDLTGPSATCYIVRANGTATSETQTVGPHAGINGATLYVGRAINNSSWNRHIGFVRRIRVINGVAATADNHRYLHGTEQAALSVTDWAGSESDPGVPSYDYNANDGNAGSNNAAWLAEWTQTGQIFRGYATPSTLSGTNTLLVTGTGSASVEVPEIGKNMQYVFGSQLYITNKTYGYDQCFLTIGDIENQIALISRSANSNKFEVHSKLTDTYTEIGTYTAGKWLPITVKIGGGYAVITLGKTNVVSRLNEQQPRFYIGQGYLGTITAQQLDGFHLDMDKANFHVGKISQQYTLDADPTFRSINVVSSNATMTVQGESPVLRVYTTNTAARPQALIEGSVPTLTFLDSDSTAKTNHMIASGNTVFLMNDFTQAGSSSIFSYDISTGEFFIAGPSARFRVYATGGANAEITGLRYNGTYLSPTAVQSGNILSIFGAAGHNGTAPTGPKGAVIVTATENWTTGANGSKLSLDVTPNGSTTRNPAWTVDQDGALISGSTATGPSVSVGSGAPASSRANGSLYMRTDGTGPNGYMRVNSAWESILTSSTSSFSTLSIADLTLSSTFTFNDDAPVVQLNASNLSSGARINVTGGSDASGILRFQTNFTTTHTLYGSGAIGLRNDQTANPPTLADGMFWYRSDVDKFYGRQNGVTYEYLTAIAGSVTWDIGSLGTLANSQTTLVLTGVVVGDTVTVSPTNPTLGIIVTADVTGTDAVTFTAHNVTSGTIDPASTTFRVKVIKQ